ncbi:MAG: molybdopterin-dependent oxidoreductase [Alphaproteobacteria bacterium]|nr:molybdopterin-dependent oxidoreductase [Alphaproteobacteria bacterium]
MNAPILSRRNFTKGLGGLVLSFSLDPAELLAQAPAPGAPTRLPGSLNNNRSLQAWVRIGGDGNATVHTGKVELGQGVLTALWQIAVEELDLAPARVRIYSADTALSPDEGQTAGSQSIENSGTALRLACAEVRGMLVDIAAKRLAVPAETLTVTDGVIMTADRLKVTYAEAVADLDLNREATGKVPPKPVSTHKFVGQSVPRHDIPGKVTGRIAYVQDIFEAGMVHGRVVRPPRYGSTLESVDDAAVSKMPGVIKVVRDGSFFGVVAEREEQAVKAREALAKAAKWKLGPELPDPATIHTHLKSLPRKDDVLGVKQASMASGGRTLEATYTKPYLAHGSIGPSCAVATFLGGRMLVWTHSQGVYPLRNELVKALKIPAKDVRCMHVEGSGCYGQNGADDVALDAALLARAVPDKPVRLQWMRDDEFGWEPYGAAMSMSIKASLDADNKIADWQYELWSNTHSMRPESTDGTNVLAAWYMAEPQPHGAPKGIPQPAGGGDRNSIPLYDFPNQKVVHHFIPDMPIRVSALRTLGAYANVFAIESFMDEMAALAKADPVAFRLAHLKDPRAKAVIEKAAEMAGWKPGQAGSLARGRGIGFSKYKNLACYVACIADVEIDRASGKARATHVWAAVDSGLIINPDGLKNQIEGGIVQSASWTLYEQVRFDKRGIQSLDWASYPIMTMPDVPKVTIELINRPAERPLGAGEGSQGPTVAVIANAVAHATGKRLRDLPMDAARVKAALA